MTATLHTTDGNAAVKTITIPDARAFPDLLLLNSTERGNVIPRYFVPRTDADRRSGHYWETPPVEVFEGVDTS